MIKTCGDCHYAANEPAYQQHGGLKCLGVPGTPLSIMRPKQGSVVLTGPGQQQAQEVEVIVVQVISPPVSATRPACALHQERV